MSNRITIDFTSEPDVLKRVRALAKKGQRSLGKQLLFMCLPHLKASTTAKQVEYGEQAR
jgi:hypothetical protein